MRKRRGYGLVVLLQMFAFVVLSGLVSTACEDASSDTVVPATIKSAVKSCIDWDMDREFRRVVVEDEFTGSDGLALRYKRYEYLGKEKAIVVFLNGRSEYIEKHDVLFTSNIDEAFPYQEIDKARTFADLPITFISIDHAGQGVSKEGRIESHIDDFQQYVEDVKLLFENDKRLKKVIEKNQKLAKHKKHKKGHRWGHEKTPIYIMAHSMGGLIAARFAQTYPELVDGLILASPMFAFNPPMPGVTNEQFMSILGFWALPAPYGVGLPTLCTDGPPAAPQIDQFVLAAIAACHGDPNLKACFYDPSGPICPMLDQCLLMGMPMGCGAPPIDFAGLNAALQGILQLAGMGMEQCGPADYPCPDPGGLADVPYCEYNISHPLLGRAGSAGWAFQSMIAQQTFFAMPSIDKPTLILSNMGDVIVNSAAHTCDKFSEECSVVQYEGFGHELLTSPERELPIGEIKAFLAEELGL